MNHTFSDKIRAILIKNFGEIGGELFENSLLIQYLNHKTRSANRGSKSRGSFASIYAIYVLVEDYINNKFDSNGDYSKYEGAFYKDLFKRQRELPFGKNLQNHALNNRLNAEFKGLFPTHEVQPILRMVESDRYWINEGLIKVTVAGQSVNLAASLMEIINEYIASKVESFDKFILACQSLKEIEGESSGVVRDFIIQQLAPNIDARLFEIVSFAILKSFFCETVIYWGYEPVIETLRQEYLTLYKTGRTNANDGGIDFVMKPLGKFFQVTETLDFKKYFLDINKLQRYPIIFVIKSTESVQSIRDKIAADALKTYTVQAIVDKYLDCIEEIINIPELLERLDYCIKNENLFDILDEIILQSKVEFNYNDELDSEINMDDVNEEPPTLFSEF